MAVPSPLRYVSNIFNVTFTQVPKFSNHDPGVYKQREEKEQTTNSFVETGMRSLFTFTNFCMILPLVDLNGDLVMETVCLYYLIM